MNGLSIVECKVYGVEKFAKARLIKDRKEIAENAEDEFNETINYALEKLNSAYNIIENYLIEKQQ